MPLGTDHHSRTTSARFSDASTLPVHRQPTLYPGMSPQSPVPSMYACPAMGTPAYPPQTSQEQPSGNGGRSHQDEVKKDRSPNPKLNVKGGDASFLKRMVNEWLQKTTISLNTWAHAATTFWARTVSLARQHHNWWLSYPLLIEPLSWDCLLLENLSLCNFLSWKLP